MRRFLIIIAALCITICGNAGILFAGDKGAESKKEYGLSQWTLEGREQAPRRATKEEHGLSQWTLEGREQDQPYSDREKHGLSRWTKRNSQEPLEQKKI